jgi:hypothetical protein
MEEVRMKVFELRAERRPVNLRAFALSPTRDSDVVVADLSYSGCQIRSEDSFEAGEVVELRIMKRGAIEAEIRWSAKGRAGACFIN